MWLNVAVDCLALLFLIRKVSGSDFGPKLMHVVGENERLLVTKAGGSTIAATDCVLVLVHRSGISVTRHRCNFANSSSHFALENGASGKLCYI